MKRRVNSTNRVKIKRECFLLEAVEGEPRKIKILKLDLLGLGFPEDAQVIFELSIPGTARTQRFKIGKVGEVSKKVDDTLKEEIELQHEQSKSFILSIKVIAPRDKTRRILGLAEGVKIQFGKTGKNGSQSLLAFSEKDLGNVLWQLSFDKNVVTLVANSAIPDAEVFFSLPSTRALIFPAILRSVLLRALYENHDGEDDDASDDAWHTQWLNFAKGLCAVEDHQDEEVPEVFNGDTFDFDEANQWVETVVEAFCSKYDMKKTFKEIFSIEDDDL